MAAAQETCTAHIKAVDLEGAVLVAIKHVDGQSVSEVSGEAATKLNMEAATLLLYDVTRLTKPEHINSLTIDEEQDADNFVKTVKRAGAKVSRQDAEKFGVFLADSMQGVNGNTLLLAVGTPVGMCD